MDLSLDKPIAGVLAPLFAIRSEDDLGVGDVECLRKFVDWAAEIGFGLVQLLPMNEMGNDNSPYNAISSVAIEPTSISISPASVPDLSQAEIDRITSGADLAKLRAGPVIYRGLKALHRSLLARAFANFSEHHLRRNTSRARNFRAFVRQESTWLDGYVMFRALMDEHGSEQWDKWPEEHHTAVRAREWLAHQSAARRREFERESRFFAYVQWLAFSQWTELKAHCERKNVALMGDVPFGINYYSADVFSQPEIFDLKWSGGAPPEPYFKDDQFVVKWGQNWGVPLYRWDMMRGDNFAWWRQRVGKVRKFFHLFRIDHALGFYRIYGFPWRPECNADFLQLSHDDARARTGGELPHFVPRDDWSGGNAEANRREGEERLRALVEVVGEHRLIAEDLGSVPEYVRPNLASLRIPGFKIPMWERQHDGRLIEGRHYQRLSVATYATHDHEPLKVLWQRWTATIAGGGHEAGNATHEMRSLAEFAGVGGAIPRPWDDGIHEGLLRGLFQSNSWIAVCMITDLLATEQRFNVPGAIAESNWSARLPHTVVALKSEPSLRKKLERVRRILVETKRCRPDG
jgi:4-alpha-glucanotransferase